MNNNPIGVFDSGVGGISTLNELTKQFPNERFIFYGDTKNAPYGSKTPDEVFSAPSASWTSYWHNTLRRL